MAGEAEGQPAANTAVDPADEEDAEPRSRPRTSPSPFLRNALLKAAASLKERLALLDVEIDSVTHEIKTLFSDLRRTAYRLHSVFIHRGTAAGGHYWVYIRDFGNGGLWRCYNDSAVTLVDDPARTVFAEDRPDRPGLHPATPNLLVYVREDYVDSLVNAVCRQVPSEEEMEEEAQYRRRLEEYGKGGEGFAKARDVEMVDLAGMGEGLPIVIDDEDEDGDGIGELQVINGIDVGDDMRRE